MSVVAQLAPLRRPGTVGYTAGVFDMFHMGHLHLLRAARERCDYLVVGVTTEELAFETKGKLPVVPLLERMAIVQSVRYVDHVVVQQSPDKRAVWQAFMFDVVFAGDNLREAAPWPSTEKELADIGVRVEYLPATYARSGELLERGLKDLVAE